MSTEHLTPEEIIEKKYLLRQLCQNTKWRLLDAMEEYAAQQAEQQTKQLRQELEKLQNSNSVLGEGWRRLNEENKRLADRLNEATDIIIAVNSGLNVVNTLSSSGPTHMRIIKFLHEQSKNNEG